MTRYLCYILIMLKICTISGFIYHNSLKYPKKRVLMDIEPRRPILIGSTPEDYVKKEPKVHPSLFQYSIESLDEPIRQISLTDYFGKNLYIVVNIGTKHPNADIQMKELQQLYNKYKEKIEIFAIPSDCFYNEPGENAEILAYIKKLQITFPVFGKVFCAQAGYTSPIYKFLGQSVENGIFGPDIRTDFTKFLCDSRGNVLKRLSANISILEVENKIKKLLMLKAVK